MPWTTGVGDDGTGGVVVVTARREEARWSGGRARLTPDGCQIAVLVAPAPTGLRASAATLTPP